MNEYIGSSVFCVSIYLKNDEDEEVERLHFSEAPIPIDGIETGCLLPDSIGEISEIGEFTLGGGTIQNRPVNITLSNGVYFDDDNFIGTYGDRLFGRPLIIREYSTEMQVTCIEDLPIMFAGTITDVRWDETTVTLTAALDFETLTDNQLSENGLPIAFGQLERAKFVNASETKILTNHDLATAKPMFCIGGKWPVRDVNVFETEILTNVFYH